MFDILLYLIIFLCCSGCGLLFSLRYSNRTQILRDLADCLRLLAEEMRYRREPLPVALKRVSEYKENAAGQFFFEVSATLKRNRGTSLEGCWKQVLLESFQKSNLKASDLAVLSDVGIELGKSDMAGQENMFSRIFSRMESCEAEALAEEKTKGKMYKSMGITLGIVIIIILI